ncbi:MAG: hypothetical protein Hals2KO_01100 [Halioglobus sp.]
MLISCSSLGSVDGLALARRVAATFCLDKQRSLGGSPLAPPALSKSRQFVLYWGGLCYFKACSGTKIGTLLDKDRKPLK